MNTTDYYVKSLIRDLKEKGIGNYSKYYKQIKEELYDNGIYNGNYDCIFYPDNDKLKPIRIIQEDEYDNNEKENFPKFSDIFTQQGGYIFIN